MVLEVVVLAVLIAVCGFFSAAEMAYVLSNKLKIEVRQRGAGLAARSAHYFVHNPEKLFSTVLIGINIAVVGYASISAIVLVNLFGMSEWEVLVYSTLVILIIGELIPKYLAREMPDTFFFLMALPLHLLSYFLLPLVKVTSAIASFLASQARPGPEGRKNVFNRDEIELLVNEGQEAGTVNEMESGIIKKAFDLREQRVYETMRPRTEIVGVELGSTISEVIQAFAESGYSKLPVYEENLDNIKGVVFAYDLFKDPPKLETIMREILYVPETKKAFDMLNEFLKKRASIAVVIDEFGGTAGIVTMEDIMEELFGEIQDEYDVEENVCRRLKDGSFLMNGKVEIDYLNEEFNLQLAQGDYETIAGYITYHTGRIPAQGETVLIGQFQFLIVRSSRIRVEQVKVTLLK